MGGKVTKFPKSFKARSDGAAVKLECMSVFDCDHGWGVEYIVREDTGEITCGVCNTKLDAMWVLRKIAPFIEDMRNRQRAKCAHCGKMTRV